MEAREQNSKYDGEHKKGCEKMKLRNYQVEIAEKGKHVLEKYHLLYLAMQTRTGKTLTALTIASICGKKSVLFLTKLKAP